MSSISQVNDGARPAAHLRTRALYVVAFLVFLCAAGATLYFNYSMAGGMAMPGNWTMSMMWMPMAGDVEAAAMFVAGTRNCHPCTNPHRN